MNEFSTGLEGWKRNKSMAGDVSVRSQSQGRRGRAPQELRHRAGGEDMGRRCKYAERNHRNEDKWL